MAKTLHIIVAIILWWINSPTIAQVYTSQIGYIPDARKYVFSQNNTATFRVLDSSDSNVLSGTMTLFRSNDPATGMTLYRGDFSALQSPGKYRVVVGSDTGDVFTIADSVNRELFHKALKSYYFQRCGMALLPEYAGVYAREKCHQADGFLHISTGQSGFHLARHSWHDAGDFGKYTGPAAVTTGEMLLAYELFPDKFMTDNLNIPESGNNVPDILDECRYALQWLLTMQDTSGGFYHKLTAENFAPFIMPAMHTSQRFLYQVSSAATGSAVAVLARAARVFASIDASFASECLTAAVAGWQFLQLNPDIVPPGGFQNPPGTNTGQYGDGNDSDERLWAAAELFETTGNGDYHSFFMNNYSQTGLFTAEPGWQNVSSLALLTYVYSNQSSANQGVISLLKASLDNFCNNLLGKRNQNGFQVAVSPGEYYWGSNGMVLNRGVMLLIGGLLGSKQSYIDAAYDQLHYVTGVNAHRLSFVTGTGTRSPKNIHHRPSAADNVAEPIPGLLAGGPDQFRSDPILQDTFTAATPPALCYVDHIGSYASNEVAIYWNAPLVVLAGYFNQLSPTAIISSPSDEGHLIKDFKLLPNYPNPFNGNTFIRFRVHQPTTISIKIVSINGQQIWEMPSALRLPGEYEISWNGTNQSGTPVSSGSYFLVLSGNNRQQVQKLTYIR
jgi:endoglucanase